MKDLDLKPKSAYEYVKKDLAEEHVKLILDGTKAVWYKDRIDAMLRGEKVAPVTIDMALTRACNYACGFCYATMQENDRKTITKDTMTRFLDDCAEIGVKGISLVSDGESTLHPAFEHSIVYGHSKGLSMAVGSNGFLLDERRIRTILPALTYFRFNFSGGEPTRYAEIMGVKPEHFHKVCENVATMVRIKKEQKLKCTIGLQMVVDPRYADQVVLLAKLGRDLNVDYLVLKHCSDSEDGELGVNYDDYDKIEPSLKEAESYSTKTYDVAVKWSKIKDRNKRSYSRCYGAPLLMQISGSGLVTSCGMHFNDQYAKFHIGNIVTKSFKEMFHSERYWEVMKYLSSDNFDARSRCGALCLQHRLNDVVDKYQKGEIQIEVPNGAQPEHVAFI